MGDRDLIGRLIDREIPRHREVGTVQGLVRASGVSRSTLYRAIRDEDPKVDRKTFARIEAGLGLETDTLIHAGNHELDQLVEIGCSADLVAWVRKEIIKKRGEDRKSLRQSV
jgi:hypothetical protein